MKSGELEKAWLLKVGGGLLGSGALGPLLKTIDQLAHDHDIIVTPGGGHYADYIRGVDKERNLGEFLAHEQAVLAVAQYGHELAAHLRSSLITRTKERAVLGLREGLIPVFIPYPFAVDNPDIPKSWDATSDTISAHVARHLEISKIVLLKSVDGYIDQGEFRAQINCMDLSKTDLVDPLFCDSLPRACDCYIINGGYPERLVELLNNGETLMTKVCPNNL